LRDLAVHNTGKLVYDNHKTPATFPGVASGCLLPTSAHAIPTDRAVARTPHQQATFQAWAG
jgi:hypothetical protein